jgi:HEAT repeat protein
MCDAMLRAALALAVTLAGGGFVAGQSTPTAGTQQTSSVSAEQVRAATDRLGNLEFNVRSDAARTVRRAPPEIAIPALREAARSHSDGYVRFRALVILSGFNDPRAGELMAAMLADPNDRLRSAAYTWFEHHPNPSVVPKLIDALAREESEFVRPSLTRALASHAQKDPAAQKAMIGLVMKGQAFFRSVVIEALGDTRAAYAIKPILEVAGIDGPLQDDAALALGKIGDKSSLPVLAKLQQSAPRESQPAIAAAICLLGVNCPSHEPFIVKSLDFAIANPGFQELLRGSANALAALAGSGRESALVTLVEVGAPSRDPARAAMALAIGTVALRNTPFFLKTLERERLLDPATELLREAFDMLEEDIEEEQFYADVRRAYWQNAEGSPGRRTTGTLITRLEF